MGRASQYSTEIVDQEGDEVGARFNRSAGASSKVSVLATTKCPFVDVLIASPLPIGAMQLAAPQRDDDHAHPFVSQCTDCFFRFVYTGVKVQRAPV